MTDWRLSIFGVIMLFVVYYLQDGIVGFVRNALNLRRPKARLEVDGRRRRAGRCGRRRAATAGGRRRGARRPRAC